MTFHLIVVCSRNVCRSPLAGAIMAQALADSGHGADVVVDTAGVTVLEGQSVCPEIVRRFRPGPDLERRLGAHSARQLTVADVEQADLVLAADRAVRAAVVRLSPRLQSRVFTMRQMAELTIVDAGAHFSPSPRSDTYGGPSEVLLQLATRLDLTRGATPTTRGTHRPRLWSRRVVVHPHDILDAHMTAGTHATTATLLRASVDQVTRSLVEALSNVR